MAMALVDAPLDDRGVLVRLGGVRPDRAVTRTYYDGVALSVRVCCTCGATALIAANPVRDAERLEAEFWRGHAGASHQPCDEQAALWARVRRLIEEAA